MAHLRRGIGRAGVQRQSELFQKESQNTREKELAVAKKTVETLEQKLTEFAKTHQKEIQNDPAFRKKVLDMCAALGVDPLLSTKGIFSGALGMGDFYYELAVKVAEVCLASRSRNGGIMSITEVQSVLMQRGNKSQNGGLKYSKEDIITSIRKLEKLGSGFRTVNVGSSCMVISVPTILNNDHMEVMELARGVSGSTKGYVTIQDVQKVTKWSQDRCQRALSLLLSQGMVWLDKYSGLEYYWFPSIWKEDITFVEE